MRNDPELRGIESARGDAFNTITAVRKIAQRTTPANAII
jgi:hypothetical protein